ncbi:MAG: polysaccharide biosynthesis protein, partial [Deltaproteobacteria bacterium]|nr:polysaccharide biosynthesis protein [Deltaproteobacteria bacterium]
MSRYVARGAQIFIDLGALSAAYWLAFLFRFEFAPSYTWYKLLFFTWPYVVIFKYLLLVLFGVPRFSWRYVSLREVKVVAAALGMATAVLAAMRYGLQPLGGVFKYVGIPFGILCMDYVLALVGITGVRALRRMVAEKYSSSHRRLPALPKVPTVLIGAGEAGVMVAREIAGRPDLGIAPVCFLDDDPGKQGSVIHGIRVGGTTADIAAMAERHGAHQALITIAGAAGKDIRRIKALCDEAGLAAKIIPGIYEIVGGTVNLSHIRPVAIEDLLGREPVKLDVDAISAFIQRKVVLVTGAGGSIGSELCRQVAQFGPARLILVERFENALFEIHGELRERWPELVIEPRVADITDR